MKKRRNLDNTFTQLLIQIAIILVAVVVIFGGLFNHIEPYPPIATEPETSQQTTEYEPETNSTQETVISNVESIPETSTEVTETIETTETVETTQPTPPIEPETQPNSPVEAIGTVYLTFDDGPSPQITSKILDILKEKNVKATFFILDYSYGSEKESIVIREFDEGHTVALHGTSHDYSKIYTSLEALIENFTTLQEKVKTSTGYTSTIIRFPGGSSNTVSKKYCSGIMTEAVNYFSSSEFLYFDWNIDSRDAGGVNSSQELYENVINGLKPGRDNVILMHDSSNKQFTLEALEAIIDFCLAEGYEFKAITSETPQVTHNVSN